MTTFAIQSAISDARKFAIENRQSQSSGNIETTAESGIRNTYIYPGCWGNCSNDGVMAQRNNDWIWGVLSALIAGAAAYAVGKEFGRMEAIQEQKDQVDRYKTEISNSWDPKKVKVMEMLQIQEKILDSMESKVHLGIMVKIALVVSALVFTAGIFSGVPLLIGMGLVQMTFAGAAVLFDLGYEDADASIQEQAIKLYRATRELES